MIIEGNNLRPSPNYKYITNGEVWSDWVILGKNDSVENWHDTNDEPPEPPIPEEEATIEDYQSALNELGVKTND